MFFKQGDRVVYSGFSMAKGVYTVAHDDPTSDYVGLETANGLAVVLREQLTLITGSVSAPSDICTFTDSGRWSWPPGSGSGGGTQLPVDAATRKAIPLYSGLIKYFPDALIAVAEVSRIGNDQHNPGKPLHWDRNKSTDEHDALLRHLFEAGGVDRDGVRHSAKVAWRALAALQKEIEVSRGPRTV